MRILVRWVSQIRYVDSQETDTVIQLATEPVTPLEIALREDHNMLGISWGIHQVAKALEFLSGQFLLHRNIRLSSVFCDRAGEMVARS